MKGKGKKGHKPPPMFNAPPVGMPMGDTAMKSGGRAECAVGGAAPKPNLGKMKRGGRAEGGNVGLSNAAAMKPMDKAAATTGGEKEEKTADTAND